MVLVQENINRLDVNIHLLMPYSVSICVYPFDGRTKSQRWGIGHWFVFKRVCVHCNMPENDLFLRLIFNHFSFSINLQTHQSHLK